MTQITDRETIEYLTLSNTELKRKCEITIERAAQLTSDAMLIEVNGEILSKELACMKEANIELTKSNWEQFRRISDLERSLKS